MKLYPYTISPLARREFYSQVEYLNEIDRRLAVEFIATYKHALTKIRQFPQASRVLYEPDYRMFSIRKFKIGIVYSFRDDKVYIYSVAPHRKEPMYWADRKLP